MPATGSGGSDVRLLRTLLVLGDELHVGRAAQRLHLTQPAVSKHLAQLERSTGLALFVRHSRGLTQTDAGRLLIGRARHVVEQVDAFDGLAARARRSVSGQLVLGFVGQAANELTPGLLRDYRLAHPDVVVELRQHDMADLTAGLTSGESDLALLRLPVSPGTPPLVHEPVLVEPRVAVLPAGHRLAERGQVGLAELFDEPWLVSASADPVYQDFALETAARAGVPAQCGPTVRNVDEYLECVLAWAGIGLAPASAARYYSRPGVVYVSVPDARPSVCALSWLSDARLGPPAAAMVELVRRRPPPR